MKFIVPSSLKSEHDELHQMLKDATGLPGRTGEAAGTVARLLHPHFLKEEEYALPPLGLLPALAQGNISPGMKAVLSLTDRLKSELDVMLAEHKQIVAALEELIRVSKTENHPGVSAFAEKLMLHAKTEEEVIYPAAILIGEYLKLKF